MWRLHSRGAANRGVAVDADGAMIGPDCALVERTASGYRAAEREPVRGVQRILDLDRDDPNWLYAQSQRIADALNRGELALAQIYGLRIPVRELDGRKLKQLAAIAALAKAGFDPDEPRIPAGEHDGGEWTTGGGGSTAEGNTAADATLDANDDGGDNTPAITWQLRTPDTGSFGEDAHTTPAALDETVDTGESEAAPAISWQFAPRNGGTPGNAASDDETSTGGVTPISYSPAPNRAGNIGPTGADLASEQDIEAQLIEAGYTLPPLPWDAIRALYRIYMAPGSTSPA